MINKLQKSIVLGLIEQIINLGIGFILNVLMIKYIPRYEYGIYNYILSFMVFINLINIAPENYLFTLKKKRKLEKKYLEIFCNFNLLKGLFILILFTIIGIYFGLKERDNIYILIGMGNGINIFIAQFFLTYKVLYEINFWQDKIMTYNTFARVIQLLLMFFLILKPSICIVLISFIVYNMILSLLIYLKIKKDIKINLFFSKNKFLILKATVLKYSLWTHLSGAITNMIYKIDPFILGFFVGMKEIGTYSIALNISNYFIIFFQVLQKNVMIGIRDHDNNKSKELVLKFILISFLFSLLQILFLLLFGKIFLKIFVEKDIDKIYYYLIIIVIGLSFLNISRPIMSYLSIKGNVKTYFLQIIMPIGIVTIFIYIIMTYTFGIYGTAFSNIICYFIFSISLFYKFKLEVKK